ncbi:MAG: aromatic ring-hydroxylating dioxygenase subunit alpha [Pseudomonadales bacterium]|nr:aromatic ring-hydroxylating dioxygenase subunit alpha [Pseudomonadales bacterium]
MAREALVAMTRREVENLEHKRIDLAPDILRVPTSAYCDPERFQREVARIFRRLPLALGFSCEMRQPGDYRAMTVSNVPVLMVRGTDGVMRAFVNMCSHRGNYVVDDGEGNARRFRCEYHAWVYGLDGTLTSVFEEKNFGCIDKGELGLTPLPCTEKAGIVWVTLDPNSTLDLDVFLAGYGEMLEHLRFDDCYVGGRQSFDGPNWKVAYDGYRDFYHVPILHYNTFGPDGPFQPDFYAWGPHVRVTSPKGHDTFRDRPESEWTNDEMTPGVWTIFPNVSIAGSPTTGGYMVSQMFPGDTVDSSFTIQNFLRFGDPAEASAKELAANMAFLRRVVEEEDYRAGLNVQRALSTGAKAFSLFGRNEGGGQLFHRWVDALLETPDDKLADLLQRGIG